MEKLKKFFRVIKRRFFTIIFTAVGLVAGIFRANFGYFPNRPDDIAASAIFLGLVYAGCLLGVVIDEVVHSPRSRRPH